MSPESVLDKLKYSDSLTFCGCGKAHAAVTADGFGICEERINTGTTVWQLHCHQFGLIVCTDSMVGFNIRGVQDWFLFIKEENKKQKSAFCWII